jgi:hypothetical protein
VSQPVHREKPSLFEQLYALETPCIACGYNLAFAPASGKCPECAAPVADLLRATRYGDPFWLLSLAYLFLGASFLVFADLLLELCLLVVPWGRDNLTVAVQAALYWSAWLGIAVVVGRSWPWKHRRPVAALSLLCGVSAAAFLVTFLAVLAGFVQWAPMFWIGPFRGATFVDWAFRAGPLFRELGYAASLLLPILLLRCAAVSSAIIGVRQIAAVTRISVTICCLLLAYALVARIYFGNAVIVAMTNPGMSAFRLAIDLGPKALVNLLASIEFATLSHRAWVQHRYSRTTWERNCDDRGLPPEAVEPADREEQSGSP